MLYQEQLAKPCIQESRQIMPFTPSPYGDNRHKVRTIYPFIVIPMLALLLTVGAFTFYVKSQAAPADKHIQHTRNASTATPASLGWYFDAGSVGKGFQEYITLQNPNATAANVTITYYLQATPTPNPIHTRTVNHTIAASTRQTIDVDNDLGTSQTGPHIDAAAQVQVTNNVPVIAERPWYVNALGITSGTDAFGVLTPQKAFYFAEADSQKASQAGQPAYNTYVSIFNPSTTATTNVTITYFTGQCGGNGQAACLTSQASLIPLQRAVLTPTNGLGVHTKFAISVTANNPIVAERLMYIKDSKPSGMFTSGAIVTPGATIPGTNWLFAEGYTGTGFQEDLELANFGTTAANANVKLEYTNGTTQTVPVTVPALGFAEFDVNAHRGATSSVSAQITSDNPIVAERLMYFHFGPKNIQGTTDVVGEPAAQTTYAFAEGYTLGSFNEFLTLQNPNATAETATVTYYLTTTSFSATYSLPANSRTTINVNTTVASRGGGAVSMLVTASGTVVAERPMYFIYGTSQGGSDVIGFTGS
jgi:hypothetical protein